jgi:hypothetical protein
MLVAATPHQHPCYHRRESGQNWSLLKHSISTIILRIRIAHTGDKRRTLTTESVLLEAIGIMTLRGRRGYGRVTSNPLGA